MNASGEAMQSPSRPQALGSSGYFIAPPPPSEELPEGRGYSSPPPESSFRESREHDDALLLKQTRIWIEEVLNNNEDKHIRELLANKATSLSELLADGEILLAVSKVFQKMLPVEVQKLLGKDSVSSNKITKKFPYDKVERFLRVCQMWELSDTNLFTPSDVVHKRYPRNVCMHLRSLSKKVESVNSNVPDFDAFKSLVIMHTNTVESLRRNLESSSGSSVPVSHDMRIGSRHLPNDSPFPDRQDASLTSSSTFTPSDGLKSNGDENNIHLKLANGGNADLPVASSVGDEEVSTNSMEASRECLMIRHRCDASKGQRDVVEDKSGQNNNPLPLAATQQGQGVDRVWENCRDIPYIDDMKEMNDPSSNGGLENCEDADKTVAQQCKPMLKLIAGSIVTVAAVGILLWWQLRKMGIENAAPRKYSLPKPTKIAAMEAHSSRKKQERADTNKVYPALELNFC